MSKKEKEPATIKKGFLTIVKGKLYNLEKNGVKKILYYNIPVINQVPPITVCTFLDEKYNAISRGISICSPLDKFKKKDSRNRAYGRAVSALFHKKDLFELKPERFDGVWYHPRANNVSLKQTKSSIPYNVALIKAKREVTPFLCSFLPCLNDYEKKILENKNA